MPSILKTKERRVLRYFNKYGFTNIILSIYLMDINSSINQLVELELEIITNIKPNLKVDLIARGSGYHQPMSL